MRQERAMQTKGQSADGYEQLMEHLRAREQRRRKLSQLVKAIQSRAAFRDALRTVGVAA
jgi:hypothetical protein